MFTLAAYSRQAGPFYASSTITSASPLEGLGVGHVGHQPKHEHGREHAFPSAPSEQRPRDHGKAGADQGDGNGTRDEDEHDRCGGEDEERRRRRDSRGMRAVNRVQRA